MPKDDSEKAAKKALKAQKRAEAAAAAVGTTVVPVDENLVEDVEMGDASKSVGEKVRV